VNESCRGVFLFCWDLNWRLGSEDEGGSKLEKNEVEDRRSDVERSKTTIS
jgi:hypothetical protein